MWGTRLIKLLEVKVKWCQDRNRFPTDKELWKMWFMTYIKLKRTFIILLPWHFFFGLVYHWIVAHDSFLNGFWHDLLCGHCLWVDGELLVSVYMFWHAVHLVRMVKPSWVLLSSCARGLTLNVEVIMTVLMESATWTALQKMVTALTLWTQQGRTGKIQQSCTLHTIFTLSLHYLYILLFNPSQMTRSTSASVISGEEQFEDYGESEDVEFTPSSPCPEEDTRTNGFSDLGSSLPSRWAGNRKLSTCSSRRNQDNTWDINVNIPLSSQCRAHSSKDAPSL